MATGQTLLDLMEVMDRGLQLQSGETGVTRALSALNASQDHFESILALEPNVHGSSIGTVTTAANTESTAFPSTLMRLDRLQFIGADTSRPAWDLDRIGLLVIITVQDFPYPNIMPSRLESLCATGQTGVTFIGTLSQMRHIRFATMDSYQRVILLLEGRLATQTWP